MTIAPEPIRRRKLSDDVQERLLAIVEGGDLKPGDPLPSERELMAAYGVGRPAIREAMQNLQRMGLIDIRQGERPRVAAASVETMFAQLSNTVRHMLSHSETNLQHLKEARATFEMEMTRIAARHHSAEDIAGLREILKQQSEVMSDHKQFLAHDGAFHAAIARISGNPIFSSLSEALFEWLARFHVEIVSHPGLENLTISEHGEIIAAIEAGDPEAAAKAMGDHLYRANSLYHQKHYQPEG